ncbi:MAG: aldose epimerase family protein [Phocaeicola sp.]|nr:aldose epimerase family protein [Phocaeicola sp.]
MKKSFLSMGAAIILLSGCASQEKQIDQTTLSGLNPVNFETTVDSTKNVKLYTLTNSNGMEVCVTNFGGRIVSIMVPDKNGKMTDVVLGFDNIKDYQNIPSDFGASIGRYANRINQGKITIDGQEIQLPKNNFGHCLHGGPTGWQYQVYEANQTNDSTIVLTMKSADSDNNFPGNVTANVTYTLTEDNAIDIKYNATTDKKTVINMTNHSYFNLSGDMSKPATDHILYVAADSITPVDSTFMTTGEMMAVKDTPFDFNTPKSIAPDVTNFENEQVKFGNGFDHNWVLTTKGDIRKPAAKLLSPTSGIYVEVYTNEPGIQVYTGNFLTGEVKGKNGVAYPQRASVCLETQHYPDSPNKPQWPSVILEPGQKYQSECIFKFGVEK